MKVVLNMLGSFRKLTLLHQDYAQQIFQLGELMAIIHFHALAGALLRGREIMQIVMAQGISEPRIGKVYRVQCQQLVSHGHQRLPLLLSCI